MIRHAGLEEPVPYPDVGASRKCPTYWIPAFAEMTLLFDSDTVSPMSEVNRNITLETFYSNSRSNQGIGSTSEKHYGRQVRLEVVLKPQIALEGKARNDSKAEHTR